MSLTLLTRLDNTIYMSADYRRSIDIEGKQYAVANDTSKIMYTKDKIIFGAGKCDKYTAVFNTLVEINDFTIEEIVSVCRAICPYDSNKTYEGYVPISLALVVATLENGIPYYYRIFENNNYEPIREELIGYYFLGAIEDGKGAYEWLHDYRGNIVNLYKDFYYKNQNEGIGGIFSLFSLDSQRGVRKVIQSLIPEKKGIKWVRFYDNNTLEIYSKSHGNIYARNLDNGGITTSKIADDAVTPSKLDRVYASEAYVDNLIADKASIEQLHALSADIDNLSANMITASRLSSMNISCRSLFSAYEISAPTSTISGAYIEGNYGDFNHLYVNGATFYPTRIQSANGDWYVVLAYRSEDD